MNITHVINLAEIPDRIPFAGAEQHLFLLMKEQAERGCTVEFLPLVFHSGPTLERKFEELRLSHITVTPIVFKIPFRWFTLPLIVLQLIPLFRTRRHHLIHTHLDMSDFVARIAAYVAGCRRLVNTFHNDEPHYRRLAWKLQLSLLDRFTSHSIAISDHIRHYLINTVGLPAKNITTVHYGVKPPPNRETKASARKILSIDTEAFVVGFVGRLEEQKNPMLLINAITGLNNVQVVFVGSGSLQKKLMGAAEALPKNQIHFVGQRPDAAALMSAFDLLCLPSQWEGLGLVLLEAMIRGVPTLGSNAGAIPEILGNGKYGLLFASNNVQDLQARIEEARRHPQQLETTAQAAKLWVRQHFSSERMVSSTLKIYGNI